LHEFDNKRLANLLAITYKLANDFCAYGFVPVLSDIYFQKVTTALKKIVGKAIKEKSLDLSIPEIVTLLFSSKNAIPSRQARIELLKLVLSFKNQNLSKKELQKIDQYYHKWFWTNYGHLGPRLKREEIAKNIKYLLAKKDKVKNELAELKAYSVKLAQKQNLLFLKNPD
jgi:hypothetical protein